MKWRERTPPDFRWAVKASRFLTHIKRLREPEEPVGRLMERAAGLEHKLDTILLQLPPTLKADADLLRECLAQFPAGTRVAVEPRHDSWWTDEIRALLERYGAALCWADRDEKADRAAVAHHRLGLPALPPRLRELGATGRRRCSSGPTGWPPPGGRTRTCSSTSTTTPAARRSSTPCVFADAVRRAGGTPTRVPTPEQAAGLAWTPTRRRRGCRRRPSEDGGVLGVPDAELLGGLARAAVWTARVSASGMTALSGPPGAQALGDLDQLVRVARRRAAAG